MRLTLGGSRSPPTRDMEMHHPTDLFEIAACCRVLHNSIRGPTAGPAQRRSGRVSACWAIARPGEEQDFRETFRQSNLWQQRHTIMKLLAQCVPSDRRLREKRISLCPQFQLCSG